MNRKQYITAIIFALAGGIIGGVISNLLLSGLTAFAKKPPPRHLETIGAEKFAVIDGDGNVRAVLGMIKQEPALMLFGREGSRPKLMIFDDKQCRIELALGPSGEPSLYLFDGKSTLRTAVGAVTIQLSETGKAKNLPSAMAIFDEEGNVLWSAPDSAPNR